MSPPAGSPFEPNLICLVTPAMSTVERAVLIFWASVLPVLIASMKAVAES